MAKTLQSAARSGWLATWLQGRRRKRRSANAPSELPPTPAVTSLHTSGRDVNGFVLEWDFVGEFTYRAYYRIHGDTAWIAVGDTDPGWAAIDLPEPTQHAFDLKVTSRGDGVVFSTTEVDSNIVVTVNDSELEDAPQIDDLNVASEGDGYVDLHWASVLLENVVFGTLVRESPNGEWSDATGGLASDGGMMVTDLNNDTTYDFKVQTFGSFNQNQFKIATRVDSNVVSGTPEVSAPPPPPTGLHVVDNRVEDPDAFASFAWTPPDGSADSYIIAVVLEGESFETASIYNFELGATSTEELLLAPNTDYEVAVKSMKNGLESDWSPSVHFTTPAI